MDGGSTDGTVEILSNMGSRISWESRHDGGMYLAINRGLEKSSGEILAYLNTDDTYYPWAVETAVSYFLRNPSIDLIYGDLAFFVEDGRGSVRLYPRYHASALRRTLGIPQPAAFWRRSVIERLGLFNGSLKAAADREFWIRISPHINIAHIEEVIAADMLRPSALRFTEQARTEYADVRRRYNQQEAFFPVKRAGDIARYYAHGQIQLARFTSAVLAFRRGHQPAAGSPWEHFIRSEAATLSLKRLAAANVLTRRRHQGLGLLRRQPL